MEQLQKRKKMLILLSSIITCIGLTLYTLTRLGMPVPCIFNKVTGLYCPGCGNTRAFLALLRFDIPGMLRCNLLFPAEAAYIIWICIFSARRYVKEGIFSPSSPLPVLDWIFLGTLLLWWILRNILHM